MRFHLGFPTPADPVALGVRDWPIVRGTERKEPSAERLLALLASSLGLAYLIAACWYLLDGRWGLYLTSGWTMVWVGALTLAVHELIHYFALPNTMSEKGFGLFAAGAFVTMRGTSTKRRALALLLAPLVAITGGVLFCRIVLGQLDERLVFASIWNAAGSILDVISAWHIARQVPRDSVVHFGTGAIRYQAS